MGDDDQAAGKNGKGDKAAPKPSIKSTVTVHDRTQIETVFDYLLARSKDKAAAKLHYKVDAYLFYPKQFTLNDLTYPKERFFQDVRPLLRFREPRLSMKQILGKKSSVKSPLIYLTDYIEMLHQGRMREPLQNAIDEVRIFACSFVSAVLKNIDRKRKRFAKLLLSPEDAGPLSPEVEAEAQKAFERLAKLIDKIETVLASYRALVVKAQTLPDAVGEPLKHEMRLIDEYCYYRVRDAMAFLMLVTEQARGRFETPATVAFVERVRGLLAAHDEHALQRGYILIRADSPLWLKEKYLHRRGDLKRHIWAVLFLEIRNQPLFGVQRQLGAMIAAALAAAWALGAQIMVIRQALNTDSPSEMWGIGGLLFISAFIFAYVIKDRIKEIGRSYFRSGLFREVPDHSERLYYAQGGEPIDVGSVKEIAKFIKPDALPARVRQIRAACGDGILPENEAIDGVMHYSKVVTLSSKIKILGRYPLRAVHDILRINIDPCLPRLGEPVRRMQMIDDQGVVVSAELPKVYYLDLALNYSRLDRKGDTEERSTDYFRLVIDKTGLQRVERLA